MSSPSCMISSSLVLDESAVCNSCWILIRWLIEAIILPEKSENARTAQIFCATLTVVTYSK